MRTETQTYESGDKTVEEFDERNRMVRMTDYNADGSIDYDVQYWYADDGYSDGYQAYNGSGVVVSRYERRYGRPFPTVQETRQYDDLGQLEDVKIATTEDNGTLTIKYDANGNELERVQGPPPNKRFYRIRDAAYNDLEAAERLVQEDPALLHERNSIGETAFHFLVVEDAHEAVQWLFAQDSDINTRNDFGNTPLLEAAGLGYVEMCRWLLANGADLRAKNDSNETAISEAAKSGQIETLEMLLSQVPPDEDINALVGSMTVKFTLDKNGQAAELLRQRGLIFDRRES